MGVYDANLAYEDFDFWIRSSRNSKYSYQDEVLIKVRKTAGSLSTKQYTQGDDQLISTYQVCKKIKALNQTVKENEALIRRLKYEIKHAVLAEKRREAHLFIDLLAEMQPLTKSDRFYAELNKLGIKTSWLRDLLLRFKN